MLSGVDWFSKRNVTKTLGFYTQPIALSVFRGPVARIHVLLQQDRVKYWIDKTVYSFKKILHINRQGRHGGESVKVINMLNSKRNVTTRYDSPKNRSRTKLSDFSFLTGWFRIGISASSAAASLIHSAQRPIDATNAHGQCLASVWQQLGLVIRLGSRSCSQRGSTGQRLGDQVREAIPQRHWIPQAAAVSKYTKSLS